MNVQQVIIQGIKEQLFFNDYLVLPDFGGFVLKSRPAHVSASGGLLVPPSKTVSFNAQLRQNDGILATWLQNTLKCRASEALRHLQDFSEFCSGILSAKRRLNLEGIGFFYLDFENNICFEPQQDANFFSASFGLTAVSIKELAPEPKVETVITPEKEKARVFEDRTLHTATQPAAPLKPSRSYSRLVTPLLVATLFVSLLGLLVNNSSMKGDMQSSLMPGNSKTSYVPFNYPQLDMQKAISTPSAYVADANGIASISPEDARTFAVAAVEHKFNSASLNNSGSGHKLSSHKGRYEIVLGCFTVLDNARRMVKKLSDRRIPASVNGQNNKGMYVVSNGAYASREEAVNKLNELKDSFPNAWIKGE